MAIGAADRLGARLCGGLIIGPEGLSLSREIPGVSVLVGGHPVPTRASEAAGRRALALAKTAERHECLLVLLSGGASALMAVPEPPITLEDKQLTTERLLQNGATIHELNSVRKHLSAIKGGRLAAATRARCRTLVISDVVGDDPSVIGSGPTVGDTSTFKDVSEILARYGGGAAFPDRVVAHVKRGLDGDLLDTPTPNWLQWRGGQGLDANDTTVIAGRHTAMAGAAEEARRRGCHVVVVEPAVVGEAQQAAALHASRVRDVAERETARPLCVVSSGETTVRVTGAGRGGRNQEFALAFAESMSGFRGAWMAASVGTDGVDGPTDAAGAIVDGGTRERAAAAGLGPARAFLDDHDTYTYFAATGDLIHTGPTGTNVGDLQVFLLA